MEAISALKPQLSAVAESDGGIRRDAIKHVLGLALHELGFSSGSLATFAAGELDYAHAGRRTVISVQGRRAKTNNGALVGVLAAASAPSVDWVILLVPDRYKGTRTFQPIAEQLDALAAADGILLNLRGCVLVGY